MNVALVVLVVENTALVMRCAAWTSVAVNTSALMKG